MGDNILITNSNTVDQCLKVCKLAYESRNVDFDVKLVPGPSAQRNSFIPAHKIFLRSCQYFQNRLWINPKCKKAEVPLRITIPDVDQETLEVILKFIYIGEIKINQENIIRILKASSLLGLDNVRTKIQNSLDGQQINRDNWLLGLRFATFESRVHLLEDIFDFLRSTCSEILESDSFLSIDFNELKWLTSSRVFPNSDLFQKAKLNWYRKDISSRQKFLNELISFQFDGTLHLAITENSGSNSVEPKPILSEDGVLLGELIIKPEMNGSMNESSFIGSLPYENPQDPNISSTNMEDEEIDNNAHGILVPFMPDEDRNDNNSNGILPLVPVMPDIEDGSNSVTLHSIGETQWQKSPTIWGEIVPGEHCFARYSDGYYYSGQIVESRIRGDWLIEYGDDTQCPSPESGILAIRVLGVDTECWYFPSELTATAAAVQCKIIGQDIAEKTEDTTYAVKIKGRKGLEYCKRGYLLIWRDVGRKLMAERKAMNQSESQLKTSPSKSTKVTRNKKRKLPSIKSEKDKRRKLEEEAPIASTSTANNKRRTPSKTGSTRINKEKKKFKSKEVKVKKEGMKLLGLIENNNQMGVIKIINNVPLILSL